MSGACPQRSSRPTPRLAPLTSPRVPSRGRSSSVLRLDVGVLYHGRPPVELRLHEECELPGRAPHNVPALLPEFLEDIGSLQRPMQIGEDLGYVLGGHVRGTKYSIPGPCLKARVAKFGNGRQVGQQRQTLRSCYSKGTQAVGLDLRYRVHGVVEHGEDMAGEDVVGCGPGAAVG